MYINFKIIYFEILISKLFLKVFILAIIYILFNMSVGIIYLNKKYIFCTVYRKKSDSFANLYLLIYSTLK